MSNNIDKCREIIKSHQFQEINGVVVDAQTARAIITVYDALSPENQEKFASMSIGKMSSIAWKLVK